jgi:hypothetical protein
LSIEAGGLTPSMKLRRKKVVEDFAYAIQTTSGLLQSSHRRVIWSCGCRSQSAIPAKMKRPPYGRVV